MTVISLNTFSPCLAASTLQRDSSLLFWCLCFPSAFTRGLWELNLAPRVPKCNYNGSDVGSPILSDNKNCSADKGALVSLDEICMSACSARGERFVCAVCCRTRVWHGMSLCFSALLHVSSSTFLLHIHCCHIIITPSHHSYSSICLFIFLVFIDYFHGFVSLVLECPSLGSIKCYVSPLHDIQFVN